MDKRHDKKTGKGPKAESELEEKSGVGGREGDDVARRYRCKVGC